MRILFLGDFLYDYDTINPDFHEICKNIQECNLNTVLNLETALGEKGTPIKKGGPNIRSTDTVFQALKELNVVAVTMANNHSMDYGETALIDALNMLHSKNIQTVGAGRSITDAQNPLYLAGDDESIVILNYGWDVEETVYASKEKAGCNPLDRNRVVREIQSIRSSNSEAIIILIFHWGFEFNTYPMPYDIQFAHECVEKGCNLIIGHHPHVIQAKEIYNGVPIYYSLGNFYSGTHRDHFPTNFRNECVGNVCDYGLGVIYDTRKNECNEMFFEYDRNLDKTTITMKGTDLLRDISGINWKNDEYISLVKKHANSNNPILGLNEKENRKKLRKLSIRRRSAIMLRFLKKNKLGKGVYAFLKKIAG